MIKVFKYIDELDAFDFTDEFKQIANELQINEWHEGVWIGRFFRMDNDHGEHWFDNWDQRELIEEKANELGLHSELLMVIDPERFYWENEPPSHTPAHRKLFWTDVLKSLHLSFDTIFEEARMQNERNKSRSEDDYIEDLEKRIEKIRESYKTRNANEPN